MLRGACRSSSRPHAQDAGLEGIDASGRLDGQVLAIAVEPARPVAARLPALVLALSAILAVAGRPVRGPAVASPRQRPRGPTGPGAVGDVACGVGWTACLPASVSMPGSGAGSALLPAWRSRELRTRPQPVHQQVEHPSGLLPLAWPAGGEED